MQLVFATNNRNKLKEVQHVLPENIKLLSLEDIGCLENIPETQDTIEANAIQKAEYIKTYFGYDCFADDTGLEVSALDGAPGVYSARFAGEQRSSEDNMDKLLDKLEHHTDRTAQFKTVVALHFNGKLKVFKGICKGEILRTKRGMNGFGYDPIFQPLGYHQTFAEMDLALKNKISHRGKAISQLVSFLSSL